MRNIRSKLLIAGVASVSLVGAAMQMGCQDNPAPHLGVLTTAPVDGQIVRDPEKPLPEPGRDELPPPPYVDVSLVAQRMPEERAFLDAYNGVHRPRIAIFVNRTLEGELASTGDGHDHTERTDHSVTRGPGVYVDHTDVYLRPGEYDEAWAKNIDYAAIENALTDWMSASHQVTVVSPATVRSRLNDAEISRLQAGRPRVLSDLARDLDTDILIQVQARPTRQIPQGAPGVGIRLIAEAVNVLGGESIAHAQSTLPPPLDNPKINDFTRFMSRKLMSDMTAAWSSPGPTAGPQRPAASDPTTGQPELPQPAAPPVIHEDATVVPVAPPAAAPSTAPVAPPDKVLPESAVPASGSILADPPAPQASPATQPHEIDLNHGTPPPQETANDKGSDPFDK